MDELHLSYRLDVFHITQPVMSKHWRKLKALTTSGLAPDYWRKGHCCL